MISSARLPVAAALLGALGLLAACSSAAATGSAPPASTPSPTSPSTPEIRVDRKVTRTIDVSQAVPATFTGPATSVTLAASANPQILFQELDADGRVVVLRIPKEPAGSDYSRITRTSSLGFWKAGHFAVAASSGRETQGTMQGAERQVAAVVQTGQRLVWTETPSTDPDFGEWSLRTVDLKTHAVRQIAHSRILTSGRLLAVVGGTYPVVIGDWVYWATAVPTDSRPNPGRAADWQFNLQRAQLSRASGVQTVARNAVLPSALNGALVYVTYQPSTPNIYEIHRRDEPSGQDQVLVRGYRSGPSWITDLAASGRLVVWTVESPSTAKAGWAPGDPNPGVLFVLDTSTGALTRVVTQDPAAGNASIAFTRRGVLWGNGSGDGDPTEYVLDPATGTLQKLGQNSGFSQVLANPGSKVVMWATDPKNQNATVWHTGTLK